MNSELEAIKAAHEAAADTVASTAGPNLHETAHDTVRNLATAYVSSHPDDFAEFAGLDEHACVGLVDVFREAAAKDVPGMDAKLWEVEAWLLYNFEPQNIGGSQSATVRIHGQ